MQAPRSDAPEEELFRVPETQILYGPERIPATSSGHQHVHPELERIQWQQSQSGCAQRSILLCPRLTQRHAEQECAQQRNAHQFTDRSKF